MIEIDEDWAMDALMEDLERRDGIHPTDSTHEEGCGCHYCRDTETMEAMPETVRADANYQFWAAGLVAR